MTLRQSVASKLLENIFFFFWFFMYTWYILSRHLIYTKTKKLSKVDYDESDAVGNIKITDIHDY